MSDSMGRVLKRDTLTLPASAASIEAVKGKVLINHGEGFQQAATGAQANTGDLLWLPPEAAPNLFIPVVVRLG